MGPKKPTPTQGGAKSKKKALVKIGRTAQDEDDLDMILVELGEGTSPLEEKVLVQPPEVVAQTDAGDEKEGEEEKEELSAAEKKKKRRRRRKRRRRWKLQLQLEKKNRR
ncbi:hypothetical protein Dsin_016046 [Dipteronia sinensis]|uniref:Uncharacterized protein n=1 Tax=Dipteronia sinensis TaxID=43782 RepID=A0AAE0E5L7_9ROSI|nr:hypothetical protein Dsin_016046 [Dipteronia sinensis]